MGLFQSSVLNNYLKQQDSDIIKKRYNKFKKYFHDPKIQQNIRESKEEQFQEGFLRELFVAIFDYSLNPTPNFNLTTEFKNERGSKKADGAILHDGNALAVIELKGTKTKDLESIRQQAFDYKANQTGCVYVITSNFEKLRFYINNAVDFEEFNLFNLTKDQFALMHICLHKENLLKNIPLAIKNESVAEEEKITKRFYADYSVFKRELYRDLVKLNIKNEVFRSELEKEDTERANKNIKLTLFKKSQKLIDRFLFIFFAEDRGLLPANSTLKILEQWNKLNELDAYDALYNRFIKYFGYLDEGRKGNNGHTEIFAYNGGLFKTDTVLDSLLIADDLLYKHTEKLSKYDFQSQVDVNILGHIFENSLNEIESVNAEIEGADFDKQKTKRKKDGVFYTPKYITQYIVENTIGKLCDEKKAELKINETEFDAKRQKDTKKRLLDNLETYRNWLLQLTIVDPACGSGAFLNQALDFLIKEHQYLDELQTRMLGGGFVFPNIENTILENNIYGVDLNEESVEIAKLSLWLRTAQPRRKLNDLNNNIKCGNSLIDQKSVAGDRAFDWEQEFPNIFRTKEKKAWHITTATHNSRHSQRMFDYKVEKGQAVWLSEQEETIVTETIANIVEQDNLNICAYNICGDHMHLLLVCEEEEIPAIVGKLKAMSSRECNIAMGRTVPTSTRGHAPLSGTESNTSIAISEDAPLSGIESNTSTDSSENTSKKERGKTQNSLWTQKFGCKEITSDEQYTNTLNYIQNNRSKHELPEMPKETKAVVKQMTCTYKHAFRKETTGGFDVVIGNPPYVHLEKIKDTSRALEKAKYETYHSQGDIYCVFVEKGMNIIKDNGLISFIMPNKWLQAGYGKPLREYFLRHKLIELIDFGDIQIFEGATTYPCIFIAQNSEPQKEFSISILKASNSFDFDTIVKNCSELFDTNSFNGNTWVISSKKEKSLLEKLSSKYNSLSDEIAGEAYYGIKTGLTEAFLINEATKNILIEKDINSKEIIHPFLQGRDIIRYNSAEAKSFLILLEKGITNKECKNSDEAEYWLNNKFPSIFEWLNPFGEKAIKRTDKGDYWWELRTCDYYDMFTKPKIMYQTFQVKPCFIYDKEGVYCNNSMWIIPTDKKELLGILNSKMGWWLITKYCTQIQNGHQLIWKYFGQIPVPTLDNKELGNNVDSMIELTKSIEEKKGSFIKYLQSQFPIEKLSKKLQNWYDLNFGDFIKELNNAIKKSGGEKLSKLDEMEWMEVFEAKKKEVLALKADIDKTDREIDQMVYELYGLTEDEVKIVEGV